MSENTLFQATDPFAQFETWFEEATAREPNDPNAMAVATVGPDGLPNVRIVLLKGRDERGFVFYTNMESQKGQEIRANQKAALNFHWKSLDRQVRIRGPLETVSEAESDAYFASRRRGSQIGAWASDQSREIDSRAALEARVAEVEARYEGQEVPRPPHWYGNRVVPLYIEFWQGGDFRLHDRLVFERTDRTAAWTTRRLSP